MNNELYEKKRPRKWQYIPKEKQEKLQMLILNGNDSNLFSPIFLQHKL